MDLEDGDQLLHDLGVVVIGLTPLFEAKDLLEAGAYLSMILWSWRVHESCK